MEKLIQTSLGLDVSFSVHLTAWLQQQQQSTSSSHFPVYFLFFFVFVWSGKLDKSIGFVQQGFGIRGGLQGWFL